MVPENNLGCRFNTLNHLTFLDFPAPDAADIYPLARLLPSGINIVNLSPWWKPLGMTNEGQIVGRSRPI
jgi:hypothetical protein